MLNIPLMKDPLNWIIVVLMVTLGGLAAQFIFLSANSAPSD